MARDLYEALFDPEAAAGLGEEAEGLALLARVAAERRAWMPGSLAEAEYEEGLWVGEEQGAGLDRPRALAAADEAALPWPQRYSAGRWRVAVGLDPQGAAFVQLREGPGPARVQLDERWVALELRVRVPVQLDSPPEQLLLEADGRRWTLSRD